MKIVVLMSTYNGEKFIREQIESILNQDICGEMSLQLLVRDDGSTDATTAILTEYQEAGKLTWYTGENLRPAKSFWHLMHHAPESDYYAFCDQDDVWFADKLSRAVHTMAEKADPATPALSCSAVTVTDQMLNPTGTMCGDYPAKQDFAYALLYSIAPGCTFVFNAAARQEMKRYNIYEKTEIIHDWLAYKIIAMKGVILYDAKPTMYYRQHGNNVIGSQKKGLAGMWKKAKGFLKNNSCVRSRVARSLMEVYGDDLDRDGTEYRLLNLVGNYQGDKKLKKEFLKEKLFRIGTVNDRFLSVLIRMEKI